MEEDQRQLSQLAQVSQVASQRDNIALSQPERCSYISDNVKKAKRGLSDCSIFFYLYLLPISCLELFSKWCQVRQQLGIVNQLQQQLAILIKQRRKTFEELNFCNIMDLQLTLSKSKATSTTVQDVHPDIASAMVRKRPGKITICLRPERCSYISNNVKKKKTRRGLSDCSIFFYLYFLPVSCLELFSKCCQVRQQLGIVNQLQQ